MFDNPLYFTNEQLADVAQIATWFEAAEEAGFTHLFVVRYSYPGKKSYDFPVFVINENAIELFNDLESDKYLEVLDVYDLSADMEDQIWADSCLNF